MNITDVRIRRLCDHEKMKAVFSVTFDNMLVIHDVKVIENEDKTFIAMPSRKTRDGSYVDIVHPITSDLREEIEKSVLDVYYETAASEDLLEEPTV